MTGLKRWHYLAAGLVLACGCLFAIGFAAPSLYRLLAGSAAATPDYGATIEALVAAATPSTPSPTKPIPASTATPGPDSSQPNGRIVFTCQLFRYQSSEQICIMNADGSGYRRLTADDGLRHYYPSLSPDGLSVVYSQYREANVYEIYELTLGDGVSVRLTDRLGALTAPEVSPDGRSIVFMRWTPATDQDQVWLMDRDGSHPRRLVSVTGWDPTWSPDGSRILFASDMNGSNQLYVVDVDGKGLHRISDLPAIRGRSDWSPQGLIATYSGEAWKREIYVMGADGSSAHQVSPPGGNSQGPSFSPDGARIAFTAYFDRFNDENGCEIYVVRTDGSDLRRLTNNDYCDYQPRWGP